MAGLAKALGLQTRTEKVASYYHQMEQGLLPAEGVSDRVLAALAGLVDSTLEELRAAGRSASGAAPAAPGGAPAFARTTYAQAAPPEVPAAAPPPSAHECWDEVDELFCGGI